MQQKGANDTERKQIMKTTEMGVLRRIVERNEYWEEETSDINALSKLQ
jgi:hypothetical protein